MIKKFVRNIFFIIILTFSHTVLCEDIVFTNGRFGFSVNTAPPEIGQHFYSGADSLLQSTSLDNSQRARIQNSRVYLNGVQSMYDSSRARLARASANPSIDPEYLKMLQDDFNISNIHLRQALTSFESTILSTFSNNSNLTPSSFTAALGNRSLADEAALADTRSSQAYGRLNGYTFLYVGQNELDRLDSELGAENQRRARILSGPNSPQRAQLIESIDRNISLISQERALVNSRMTEFLPTFQAGESVILSNYTNRFSQNFSQIRDIRQARGEVLDNQIRLVSRISPAEVGSILSQRVGLEGDGVRYNNPIFERASQSLSRPLTINEREAILLFSQTNNQEALRQAFSSSALSRLEIESQNGSFSFSQSSPNSSNLDSALRSVQGASPEIVQNVRDRLSIILSGQAVDSFDELFLRLQTPERQAALASFLSQWDGRSESLMRFFDSNAADLADFLRERDIAVYGTHDGQSRYFSVDPHNPVGRQFLIDKYSLPSDDALFNEMLERQRDFVTSGEFVPFGGEDPLRFARVTGEARPTDSAIIEFYRLQNNPDDVGLLMREMHRDRLLISRLRGISPLEADSVIRTSMLEAEGFSGVRQLSSIESTEDFMGHLQNRLMFYDRAFHGNDLEHGPNVHLDQSYRMGQARVIAATNPEFASRYPTLRQHTASDLWLAMANDNVEASALDRQSNFSLPSGRDRALIQEVGDKVFEANPTSTLGDIRFRRVMGIGSFESPNDLIFDNERDVIERRLDVRGRAWGTGSGACQSSLVNVLRPFLAP